MRKKIKETQKKYKKGEVATILALASIVFIGVASLISSLFLNKKQTTSSKAAGSAASLSCIQTTSDGRQYIFFQRSDASPVCDKNSIKAGPQNDAWLVVNKSCGKNEDCKEGDYNQPGWCYPFNNQFIRCLKRDGSCDNGSCLEGANGGSSTGGESSQTNNCRGYKTVYGSCVNPGTCSYRGPSNEDPKWVNQWVYCCSADGYWYAKSSNAGDSGWQSKDECEGISPTPKTTTGGTGGKGENNGGGGSPPGGVIISPEENLCEKRGGICEPHGSCVAENGWKKSTDTSLNNACGSDKICCVPEECISKKCSELDCESCQRDEKKLTINYWVKSSHCYKDESCMTSIQNLDDYCGITRIPTPQEPVGGGAGGGGADSGFSPGYEGGPCLSLNNDPNKNPCYNDLVCDRNKNICVKPSTININLYEFKDNIPCDDNPFVKYCLYCNSWNYNNNSCAILEYFKSGCKEKIGKDSLNNYCENTNFSVIVNFTININNDTINFPEKNECMINGGNYLYPYIILEFKNITYYEKKDYPHFFPLKGGFTININQKDLNNSSNVFTLSYLKEISCVNNSISYEYVQTPITHLKLLDGKLNLTLYFK